MPRESDAERKRRAVQQKQAGQSPSPTPKTPAEQPQAQAPPAPPEPEPEAPTQPEPQTSELPQALQQPVVENPLPVVPQAPLAPVPSQQAAQESQPAVSDQTSSEQALTPLAAKMLSKVPAAQLLLKQVMDSQQVEGQQFHLVMLPEDGYPQLETFTSVDELIEKIRECFGQEISLFPFMGNYMPITKGPNRYLMTPFGNLPLFVIPDADEVDIEEHGYVGPDPTTLDPPEAARPPEEGEAEEEQVTQPQAAPAVPAPDDDETPVLPQD